ncbi:DUF1501 domain-containing protein [Rhodopirellula sp. MGV]|uniref:DUF1501 domain-containing protein n=1 Tax=Rhodopirellula sp. MGV TaxID=2023130 RepID=UPI000B968F2C|nr:DUF1501 domain-containing protein [Rhodopirellula sp. MGV]OYP34556.1 hypothetical protein CGZ80_14290 [Rhodopirellula sp. MGV]PNY36728.1 DUF1501 domain-containing protein [Rhodopirellula baltica]
MNHLQSSRRDVLYGLGASLGSVAFTAMMADELAASETPNDLQPRPQQIPARAKRCIFLMMEGGPSHIDTFDPKPKLEQLHLKEFNRSGKQKSAMESGKRYFVQSPFRFIKAGDCGADMAENWERLASVADELCFYRGCQVDSVNHPTAMYQMNCGNRFGGDPAMGAWVTYGLGSVNQDLPGFVVLPAVSYPQGGSANWSNGYLPAQFQGTALRPTGSPILDLNPPAGVSRSRQRLNLDLVAELNQRHAAKHPTHGDLSARMANYELAFRMQMQVPSVLDIADEDQKTLSLYGVNQKPTDQFGRKCLLARKLIENGVRFVQLYHGSWDSHDYIQRAHGSLVSAVDQPIAALISDLKARGLLESTLVVWCGEFGRSPDNGVRGGTAYGRDHNPNAMSIWMAGGGVKAGHTIGATDETGAEAVENVHHVRDLHVTLLRLLGLDDNKLTFYHAGRFKQLSQFGGKVIEELIA